MDNEAMFEMGNASELTQGASAPYVEGIDSFTDQPPAV